MSGVFTDSAMMQSIVIGLTNLTFTMIGMILIDQVGRKKLLYIGSIGMTLSLALVAKGFYQDAFSGTVYNRRANAMAGMASTPNIHCQSCAMP